MFKDFIRKLVASETSLTEAPDQYAERHVAVLHLQPAVIHSPDRKMSQAQLACLGLAGSTVHGLLRHQVHGVPLAHFKPRLPAWNWLSVNCEYTVRIPFASVLGLTVSHATVARFAPS